VKEIKLRRPRVYDVQAGSHLGMGASGPKLWQESGGQFEMASVKAWGTGGVRGREEGSALRLTWKEKFP